MILAFGILLVFRVPAEDPCAILNLLQYEGVKSQDLPVRAAAVSSTWGHTSSKYVRAEIKASNQNSLSSANFKQPHKCDEEI